MQHPAGTDDDRSLGGAEREREGLAVVMVMLGCGVSQLSTVGDMAHPAVR